MNLVCSYNAKTKKWTVGKLNKIEVKQMKPVQNNFNEVDFRREEYLKTHKRFPAMPRSRKRFEALIAEAHGRGKAEGWIDGCNSGQKLQTEKEATNTKAAEPAPLKPGEWRVTAEPAANIRATMFAPVEPQTYHSSTHGRIQLSFTARRLMANLREAIEEAIETRDYGHNGNALSRARAKIALFISKLERK